MFIFYHRRKTELLQQFHGSVGGSGGLIIFFPCVFIIMVREFDSLCPGGLGERLTGQLVRVEWSLGERR